MRKGANFLRWILTVFMVISAIVFFPSVSSVLCLLFAVLAAPVKSLQRFWKYQVKLRGGGKALLMTALVIGAALTAPLEPAPQAPAEDDRQQEIQETVQETVPEEPDASSQSQTVSQDASSETAAGGSAGARRAGAGPPGRGSAPAFGRDPAGCPGGAFRGTRPVPSGAGDSRSLCAPGADHLCHRDRKAVSLRQQLRPGHLLSRHHGGGPGPGTDPL